MKHFEHEAELLEKDLEENSGRLFLEEHDSYIQVNEGSDSGELIHIAAKDTLTMYN